MSLMTLLAYTQFTAWVAAGVGYLTSTMLADRRARRAVDL